LRACGARDLRQLRQPGAVFLDRDGTINVKREEGSYVETPEEIELLAGAAQAIKRLNDARFKVFVVTNQRGIALGRLSEKDLDRIHVRLGELLAAGAGARVDDFFHCPHEAGTCSCRKPQPGMLLDAKRRWPEIDLARSAIVGDSISDVQAGAALGIASLMIGADVEDLAGAVDRLLAATGGKLDQASPTGPLERSGS
jgi:D-glycero-D-manno-heptose 1,7-bisphosphate phosphatase